MTAGTDAMADQRPAGRHPWHRPLLAVVAVALVALASLLWWSTRGIAVPREGPWAIAVSYPVGDSAHCFDATVDVAFYTTDHPGSTLSVTFVDEATRDDVTRVLRCVEDSLASGEIDVVQLVPYSQP